jgi:hypothetical protein
LLAKGVNDDEGFLMNAAHSSPSSERRPETSSLLQEVGSTVMLAADRLGADDPAALVVGRTPFTDVFDMAKTPEADLLFIQPTHATARRRYRRADIAVERLGRTNGRRLGHDLTGLRNRIQRLLAA